MPGRAPTIDVHSHFVPPELVDAAAEETAVDGLRLEQRDDLPWLVARQGHAFPLKPGHHDLHERLRAMDADGIDAAIVSIAPTLFLHWLPPSDGAEWARLANESIARQAAESAGRVHGTATLPMQDPDAAGRELRRAVLELGLVGAQIAPVHEGASMDGDGVRHVLAEAQALDVPVILHPYFLGPRAGLEPYYMTNTVGNPLDTTVGAVRLIHGGVLDELPRLRLVLVHGGGYLPYQIGRLDHADAVRPEPRSNSGPPSSYLDRFLFDTVVHDPRALRFLAELVGWDRIVYGTDFPYDMAGGTLEDQLGGLTLSDETRRRVGGATTAAWFRLDASRNGAPGHASAQQETREQVR